MICKMSKKKKTVTITITKGFVEKLTMLLSFERQLLDVVGSGVKSDAIAPFLVALCVSFARDFHDGSTNHKEFMEVLDEISKKIHHEEVDWCEDPNCPENNLVN